MTHDEARHPSLEDNTRSLQRVRMERKDLTTFLHLCVSLTAHELFKTGLGLCQILSATFCSLRRAVCGSTSDLLTLRASAQPIAQCQTT